MLVLLRMMLLMLCMLLLLLCMLLLLLQPLRKSKNRIYLNHNRNTLTATEHTTMDAIKLSAEIESFVNSAGRADVTALAHNMAQCHRTLQSLQVNLVMEFLLAMSQQTTDARNEHAVKAATAGYKAMVDSLNGATRTPII
jgi:hypothetical protein